jgi:glycosyltransferase involved in cell wall biosynthesis
MSTGAFPIFSSHESIREWIEDGRNGLLVDPVDCVDIEQKLIRVFENRALIPAAAELNGQIVKQRLSKVRMQELLTQGYETLANATGGAG